MRIGMVVPTEGGIGKAREDTRTLSGYNFASYWVTQGMASDALTMLAAIADEVPGKELGTAVVPIFGRHPLTLAMQARTVQAMVGGRLTLGIGLSHALLMEGIYGIPYTRVAHQMENYLKALNPLLRGEPAQVETDTVTVRLGPPMNQFPGSDPVPVMLAALGPKMLKLCAEESAGTITWMTGPSTLANYIVPTIRKAAKDSGKPQPRVAAGLPVIVTKDPEAWRKRYDQTLSLYSQLPTYQETLRKEGLTRPTDVAIAGEASFVKEQLARIREAGVDDLLVHWAGPLADYRDTIELLAAENK